MDKKIRLKIIEKFDTQSDFAQYMGVADSFVSRILNGRAELKPEQASRWARAIGVRPSALRQKESV